MELVVLDLGKATDLWDVVITNPVSAEVLRSNKVQLHASRQHQLIKDRRYREKATEAGMLLHAAALEVFISSPVVPQTQIARVRSSPTTGVGE
jgi:hypothetical protein